MSVNTSPVARGDGPRDHLPGRDTRGASVESVRVDGGLLHLRAGLGVLIFWIHGRHMVPGAVAFLRVGEPWPLAEEIGAMGQPAPVVAALGATAVLAFHTGSEPPRARHLLMRDVGRGATDPAPTDRGS